HIIASTAFHRHCGCKRHNTAEVGESALTKHVDIDSSLKLRGVNQSDPRVQELFDGQVCIAVNHQGAEVEANIQIPDVVEGGVVDLAVDQGVQIDLVNAGTGTAGGFVLEVDFQAIHLSHGEVGDVDAGAGQIGVGVVLVGYPAVGGVDDAQSGLVDVLDIGPVEIQGFVF